MPVFAYRGLQASGRSSHGLIDADSVRAAWQQLRTRGIYPVTITADAAAAARGVPLADLAPATRQLASLLRAGLPLTDALAATAELSPPATARAFTLVAGRVREGSALSDALGGEADRFPRLYRAGVRAGEASGDIAGTLAQLADHLDAALARRRRLIAALTYPAIVVATTGAVLIFLVAWVLPEIRTLVAGTGARLPWPSRMALALSDVLARVWWLVPLGAAVLAIGCWAALRRNRGAAALRLLASVPLIGPLVREQAVARAVHALGTLLGAGIALDVAMPLAADAGGPALGGALATAGTQVREGGTLTNAFVSTGVFPPLVVRLVATGERTGTLAASLTQAAALLESDVARRLERLTAWLEPTLVVAAGALVLTVVSAVLVPILSLDPTSMR
jgi:general secretion pathway protein F